MKFIITHKFIASNNEAGCRRFMETGGLPPEGVTLHGRWITLGFDRGFVLAESDDPQAVFRWMADWADLIEFEVLPVVEDEQVGAVVAERWGG